MFEIDFVTSAYAPPHSIAILTHLNNWENIDGVYADGRWTFSLDDTGIWNRPGYFKFLLDDRYWMTDPYIRLAPTAGATYTFDERTVIFVSAITPPVPVPPAPPVPQPVTPPGPAPVPPVPPLPIVSEGAMISRVVLIATPFLTAGAAWIAAVIAHHVPGVTLDQTQIVSFMIAIVAVCLAGAWKWLQGWQQHEWLVANRLAAPVKPVISTIPTQQSTQQ